MRSTGCFWAHLPPPANVATSAALHHPCRVSLNVYEPSQTDGVRAYMFEPVAGSLPTMGAVSTPTIAKPSSATKRIKTACLPRAASICAGRLGQPKSAAVGSGAGAADGNRASCRSAAKWLVKTHVCLGLLHLRGRRNGPSGSLNPA